MEAFLDKLAHHLLAKHGNDFSQICLVFPSRRAGLFFKQYISRIIDKPIWLPDIYALEDFVVYKSGLKLSDPLELIARLYKVYKSIEKDKAQPFSEFISWGNMLLNDFDEIDQYMADGELVFRYLDEIKALKHWNPDGKPLTDFEQNYLHFYNSLAPCYTRFREELQQLNEGYFGLAFETLLSNYQHVSFSEWKSVVFAGYNALTVAEEKLFKLLLEFGKAEVYWDADAYYLDDPRQEAGRFLRDYKANITFGELNWTGDTLRVGNKSINITGVPGNVGQAKLAGELLTELVLKKGTADGIALVLVDEGLLLPVLNSIPIETGDFNVTMGFPLKQTPVFSLINVVLTLFANANRYAQPGNEIHPESGVLIKRFHYKDVQRLLAHPYILSAIKKSRESVENTDKLLVSKSFYFSQDLLIVLEKVDADLSTVFKPYLDNKKSEAVDAISLIKDLIVFLRNYYTPLVVSGVKAKGNLFPIELEYLFHAAMLCTKLDVILKDPELKPDFDTVVSLVNNLIAGMRLPFYGEPLNGLQVMGMLETRLLDFTDIVMISVNEGLLPRGKHKTTFIPDEVRKHFGMQLYSERTAVFAYHFYRLMQRAENVSLLYNTEGDELGGGEKSRFISQLLYEMPLVNKEIKISEQTLSVVPGSSFAEDIIVPKSSQIYARLMQMAEKGISPTALSTFLRCELQFYFSQVLRISEPDQVSETIDAATLGEIVHDALHKTYLTLKNSVITADVIKALIPIAINEVHQAFATKFDNDEITTGKNFLIVKVAENMVKRFLTAEKKYLDERKTTIEILMLEEELKSEVKIHDSVRGESIHVKIHGKADRIDRVGGIPRIIDYKTGKVENKELKLEQIADFQNMDEPSKLLQVLTYAMMYSDMQPVPPSQLISGIISLRRSSSYVIGTNINKKEDIDQELLNAFRIELETVIGRIFNTEFPFVQTENRDNCALCAFNSICNRIVN